MSEFGKNETLIIFANCQSVNHLNYSPLNKQEESQNIKNVIKVHTHRELFLKDKKYHFDRIFKPAASQFDLYSNVVAPLIQDVIAGYNCTVFAYGQTGSGKTFTMTGDKCNISGNWKQVSAR